MKRRNFTHSVITALGVSSLPLSVSLATDKAKPMLQNTDEIKTKEGLILKLNQHLLPTKKKDSKQFILTYDVLKHAKPLEEKIYDLELANGDIQQVYMTPVNKNQLQAVFNWRLNAQ